MVVVARRIEFFFFFFEIPNGDLEALGAAVECCGSGVADARIAGVERGQEAEGWGRIEEFAVG